MRRKSKYLCVSKTINNEETVLLQTFKFIIYLLLTFIYKNFYKELNMTVKGNAFYVTLYIVWFIFTNILGGNPVPLSG